MSDDVSLAERFADRLRAAGVDEDRAAPLAQGLISDLRARMRQLHGDDQGADAL